MDTQQIERLAAQIGEEIIARAGRNTERGIPAPTAVAGLIDHTLLRPEATGGQIAALVLRHVVAAAVITGMLTGLARPQGR